MPTGLIINDQAQVATGMSRVARGAFYGDETFIDGMSYTSQYDEPYVGQIQVVKYSPDNSVQPVQPGQNFQTADYSNNVSNINLNNSFQKSTKIPAYFAATMPPEVLRERSWDTLQAILKGRRKSGLAVLADKGNVSSNTTAVTGSNIEDTILSDRARIRDADANPDVIICSVDVYSAMLKAAGTKYTPVRNDETTKYGRIGFWMGIYFIESSILGKSGTYTYLDGEGVRHEVDLSGVEYIMYNHEAFAIVDKLLGLRAVESTDFIGALVQGEIVTGFLVTYPECVIVKTKSVTKYAVTVTGADGSNYVTLGGNKFDGGQVSAGTTLGVVLKTSGKTCKVGTTSYENGDNITVSAATTVTFAAASGE